MCRSDECSVLFRAMPNVDKLFVVSAMLDMSRHRGQSNTEQLFLEAKSKFEWDRGNNDIEEIISCITPQVLNNKLQRKQDRCPKSN